MTEDPLLGWHKALIDFEKRSKANGIHYKLVSFDCEDGAHPVVCFEWGARRVTIACEYITSSGYLQRWGADIVSRTDDTRNSVSILTGNTPHVILSDLMVGVAKIKLS